jgi:hypothetical protein
MLLCYDGITIFRTPPPASLPRGWGRKLARGGASFQSSIAKACLMGGTMIPWRQIVLLILVVVGLV